MSKVIQLKNGRVLDPLQQRDEVSDLWFADGVVHETNPGGDVEAIDCQGKWVCPGLIDTQVHLCEPGLTAKENIESGTTAAAAGGFTSVLALPGNAPPADDVNRIFWVQQRVQETAKVNVFLTGCASKGKEGKTLAPIGSMAQAGIVAVTDHQYCLQDNELMRRALEYSSMFNAPVMDRCRDLSLSPQGVMNEGYWSALLGMRGWPAMAEEIIVERDALLADNANARVHCMSISTAGSVQLIEQAKKKGIQITASVTPHHLLLTDEVVQSFDTKFKVDPPLRTPDDVAALRKGLREGIIDVLASDHHPHCSYEKEVEFDDAPFGVVGLETAVGIYLTHLVHSGVLSPLEWLALVTSNPAKLFQMDRGSLQSGAPADVTVIDPELVWKVTPESFLSKSRNSPFIGEELKGRAVRTFIAGRERWNLEEGLKDDE